jgi:hypothetical protein
MDVCLLSQGVMLPMPAQLLSTPLQGGLRFFHRPMPAPPLEPLTMLLPARRERYGVSTFRLRTIWMT